MYITSSNHSLQRRENHYQNKRSKQYTETQNLLKEIQIHPEILRPPHPPKQLNTLQTVLLLSAITAAFPTRTQAATTQAPLNQDNNTESNAANALVTPRSQPLQQIAAKASSMPLPLSPTHRMHGLFNITQLASPQQSISAEIPLNRIIRNAQNVSESTTELPAVTKSSRHHRPYTVRTKTKNKCTSTPRHANKAIKRLHTWINQTAPIEKKVLSPSQALGAVLYHHQVDLPESFFATGNPCILHRLDWQWIDEAAQLWHEIQQRKSSTITTSTSMPPHQTTDKPQSNIKSNHVVRGLRKKFLADLKHDIKNEVILKKLLTPIVNGTHADIFFDGIALRGAMGKNVNDLILLPTLMKIPEYAPLIDVAKKELLIKKFKRMGESIDYTVGTAAYSLDSIIQRCRTFQGQPTQYFANEKALLQEFGDIVKRWQTQHDYPIAPQFALAQHIAHTRGVEIRQHDWQTAFLENERDPWLKGLRNTTTPAQLREINSWFYVVKQNSLDESLTHKSAQTICEELQEIAYCKRVPTNQRPQSLQPEQFYIPRTSDQHYVKPGLCASSSTIPPEIIAFATAMQEKGALPRGEVIEGDTPEQRITALSQYRDDVFDSNYGQPPRFDRNQAARTILRQQGLNDAQIDARRFYNTGPKLGIGTTLVQAKEGTGIDEFLDRSKKDSLSDGAMMSITTENGVTQIKPPELLREVMLQWDNDLHTKPWIRARARENLRLAQAPVTNTTVNAEAYHVAQSYQIGIAEQDIANVEDMLINLIPIPFVGGMYDIGKGIANKNIDQIIGGIFSLGIDSIDKGISVITKLETRSLGTLFKVPHTEHAMVDMVKGAARDLDVSLEKLVPLQSNANEIGMHIHADPWKISLPDTNVPSAYRSLAERVRQGEKDVMWTTPTGEKYPVIHIVNQDRIIPAKHIGGTYHEVSWEDGRVLHHTQLIHYDKQGKIYFSMGLKGGGETPDGNLIVGGVKLKHRYNVVALKNILKNLKYLRPEFVDDLEDVKNLFTSVFPALSPTTSSIEDHFYTNLYKNSLTFQSLADRFFAQTKNSWIVEFTADGPPRVIPGMYAGGAHKKIAIPNRETIAHLSYFGVDSHWHPFTQEQINLDAILAAMNDVPVETGSTLSNSRSPNIILRDRILFEAGYPPLPQQYSSVVMSTNTADRVPTNIMPLHTMPVEPLSAEQIKTFELENRYIDNWFDKDKELQGNMPVLGTKLAHRSTVDGIRQLHQSMMNTELTINLEFAETMNVADAFAFDSKRVVSEHKTLDQFYKSLLKKSRLFDSCWMDALSKGRIGHEKWIFATESKNMHVTPEMIATARRNGFAIDRERSVIYHPINEAPNLYYLSTEGFTPIELERRLVRSMVEILTDLSLPTTDRWLNRGVIEYITERVLDDAKISLPARLSYGVVEGEKIQNGMFIGTSENPIVYQTTARRVREMENKYLQYISNKKLSNKELSSDDFSEK